MTATAPNWSRSSTSKRHKVVLNQYLCANICMLWAATNEGEYKDDQMTPTQRDSHENMVVIGPHATIINRSGKSTNIRPLSSDYSRLEAVTIVDAVVAYDCPHTLETIILVV